MSDYLTGSAFVPPDRSVLLDPAIRAKLENTTAATIATLLHKRGLRNQAIIGVGLLGAFERPMIGPARTLRFIPAREDIDTVAIFGDPRHPQRIAVDEAPAGSVLVMDCRRDASAASCGSILFARLVARGCAGLVTDAGVRDAAVIAGMGIPCFATAAAAPTNLARHHAVDIDVPIGCGGAPVYPGDIMFGDGDGVVAIPPHLVDEIADEALEMERFESFALGEVRKGRAVIGLYPPDADALARYAVSQRLSS